MSKRLTIFILLILTLTSNLQNQVGAEAVAETKSREEITIKKLDKEAKILSAYLASYNSPLEYHAQDFIDAARVYGLDWRLLPAISGVESTFGKFTPGGYNGWGWGVYGTQAIYFNSWREGIFTVAKGLRENYLDKGLTDPYSINRIYAASSFWGGKVTYFMNDLDRFAQNYQSNQAVAVSGQLVLR